MKLNLIFLLLILVWNQALAQKKWYHRYKKMPISVKKAYYKATYKYTGVEQANRLSVEKGLNKEAFRTKGGVHVVLLPIHGGILKAENSHASISVDSFYIDATEVCNLHYRNFVSWCRRIHISNPEIYRQMLPDTNIWIQKFPGQAIAEQLAKDYYRDPTFDYYPVLGISPKQAQVYAKWRTDRVNELILIDGGAICADYEGQQGEVHFSTYCYLSGWYEAAPGEYPILNIETGEERIIHPEDNILLPYFRLPTVSEWDYVANYSLSFEKNKYLKQFYKIVSEHNKIHPLPNYYKQSQNRLPRCILENTNNTSLQYIKGNVSEFAQDIPQALEKRLKKHSPRPYSIQNKPDFYCNNLSIEMQCDSVPIVSKGKKTIDKTKKQSPTYQGFRCVMTQVSGLTENKVAFKKRQK